MTDTDKNALEAPAGSADVQDDDEKGVDRIDTLGGAPVALNIEDTLMKRHHRRVGTPSRPKPSTQPE